MALGGVEQYEITGWKEARRQLRKLDDSFVDAAKKITKDAADDIADDAKSSASSLGGVAAKSAPSITAFGQQGRAYIRYGGKAYPFAMGAEFGSARWKQFKPWRGSDDGAGYFLYPAIRANQQRVAEEALREIDRLIEDTLRSAAA